MADVAFPFESKFTVSDPHLAGQRRGGQFSISGAETVVPSFRSHWELTVNFVIHGERAKLQWDAFVAQMEGGIGTTLVPVYQRYRPRDLRNNLIGGTRNTARLEGAQTFEHFGFANEPVVYARTTDAAGLRASRINVEFVNTTGLRPGHKFSFGERLYMVQRSWEAQPGVTTLEIKPTLRAAVPAGEPLTIDFPVCKMRFGSGDEGRAPDTPVDIYKPKILFREAL